MELNVTQKEVEEAYEINTGKVIIEEIEKRGYDSEKDHFNPTGSVFCEHGAGTYIPWDQVRDYMHVQSKALQNDTHFETEEERLLRKADADRRRREKAASEGFGKELEEIMLREFGPIKRREYGNGNTRYISDGKNVSGEVFQKKYKKKTQKAPSPIGMILLSAVLGAVLWSI